MLHMYSASSVQPNVGRHVIYPSWKRWATELNNDTKCDIAFREANGLVIMQKGEGKCLEKIKQAADEMQNSPASLVLKYLQASCDRVAA